MRNDRARALRALLALTAAGAAVAATLTATASAAVGAPAPGTTITGDVTGDGRADRVVLSDTGTSDLAVCVATVTPGRTDGSFGPPQQVVLPVPANAGDSLQVCPVRGVVLKARDPIRNRLAAVFVNAADYRNTVVYNLTGNALARGQARFVTEFGTGQVSASFGTVDLDGNGVRDFWRQGSDEGDGSALWLRHGRTLDLLYDSGPNPGVYLTGSGLQFADLNRAGGTDALVTTWSNGTNTPFAAVVDGRTGTVQTLATGDYYGDPDVSGFRIATMDLDHNAYPDVVVTPVSYAQGDLAPRYFVNRTQGGRWSFVELTGAATPTA